MSTSFHQYQWSASAQYLENFLLSTQPSNAILKMPKWRVRATGPPGVLTKVWNGNESGLWYETCNVWEGLWRPCRKKWTAWAREKLCFFYTVPFIASSRLHWTTICLYYYIVQRKIGLKQRQTMQARSDYMRKKLASQRSLSLRHSLARMNVQCKPQKLFMCIKLIL